VLTARWKHRKISVDEDSSQQDMVIRNISDVDLGAIFTADEWDLLDFFNEQIDKTSLTSIDNLYSN
jgi:hypothetical protein